MGRYARRIELSPDSRHFLGVTQPSDHPPFTQVMDGDENLVAEMATSDLSRFEELGPRKVDMFTLTGADGVTELDILPKPSGFDPSRKYLVLVSVYAGLIGTGVPGKGRRPGGRHRRSGAGPGATRASTGTG